MRKTGILLLAFILGAHAWGAVSLTAKADKTTLALDDTLNLTIELSGVRGNMVMPQLPSLPAFNVYAQQVDQTVTNGQTAVVFRYAMTPRFAGKTQIGPVSFSYGGKTYKTSPIDVTVYRTSAQKPARADSRTAAPQTETLPANLPPLTRNLMSQAQRHAGEDFFLAAAVDDASPYVNQPVLLGVRFYYSKQFDEGPYTAPAGTNIFMEDLGGTQGTQTIRGVKYYYVEQRSLLTAPAAGKAEIGPASVQFTVSRIPGLSRFDNLLGGLTLGEPKTVQSAPIMLDVRALPAAGRPDSFYGAVGQNYTISAQTDRRAVEAGEAVNLTVTVQGPGNLKATSDLKFPPMPGLRVYDAATSSGFLPNAPETTGYKTFKTVLVPSASGVYTVPPIAWSYFNPQTGRYHTLKTEPVTLHVTPASKTDAGYDFSRPAAAGDGFQSLHKDIAYVKTRRAPDTNNLLRQAAAHARASWFFIGLLPLGIIYRLLDKKTLAHKRAFARAHARLKKAQSAQDAANALADYLAEKCGLYAASTPIKELTAALQRRGAAAETAQAFARLWSQLDAARFAPVAMGVSGTQTLCEHAAQILKRLEGELQCCA